jgi:hypothetical protein
MVLDLGFKSIAVVNSEIPTQVFLVEDKSSLQPDVLETSKDNKSME